VSKVEPKSLYSWPWTNLKKLDMLENVVIILVFIVALIVIAEKFTDE